MFDLSPYNTFGLKVAAKEGRIIRKGSDLNNIDPAHSIILGRGSDVLLTADYDGMVLVNEIKSLRIIPDGDSFLVCAGGGNILDELIGRLVNAGLNGLENLSAIPGTVGAAPIQNVGAYGVEIGDFIEEVHARDLISGKELVFTREQCEFGYRTSYFKTHKERPLFITEVVFRLDRDFAPHLEYKGLADKEFQDALAVRSCVIELRRGKLPDPAVVGNAGSFFKNPVVDEKLVNLLRAEHPNMPVFTSDDGRYKLAAGWLIEKSGCRGITHGNAGTWEHQALVIVNRGHAKPHEIVALAKYIQAEVANTFGVSLEPEVRVFGRRGEITWDQV